jgi:hypothetical protein
VPKTSSHSGAAGVTPLDHTILIGGHPRKATGARPEALRDLHEDRPFGKAILVTEPASLIES